MKLSLREMKFLEQCAFPFPFRFFLCYSGIFVVFPKVCEVVLIYLRYYGRALQLLPTQTEQLSGVHQLHPSRRSSEICMLLVQFRENTPLLGFPLFRQVAFHHFIK